MCRLRVLSSLDVGETAGINFRANLHWPVDAHMLFSHLVSTNLLTRSSDCKPICCWVSVSVRIFVKVSCLSMGVRKVSVVSLPPSAGSTNSAIDHRNLSDVHFLSTRTKLASVFATFCLAVDVFQLEIRGCQSKDAL